MQLLRFSIRMYAARKSTFTWPSFTKGISNADEEELPECNTFEEILNLGDLEYMKRDTAISRSCDSGEKAGKSIPACQFDHEK